MRGVELPTGWDDLQESLGLQGAQRMLERVDSAATTRPTSPSFAPGPINASTLVVHDRNPGLRLKISVLCRTNASTFTGSADAGYIDSARYIVAGYRRASGVLIAAGWQW